MISRMWPGHIVADMKVADGAIGEVEMARRAGATAVTILGNAPTESHNLFIKRCDELNMLSMIDLIGVKDPLTVMRPLKKSPDVVVIHRGRDEESTHGKMIEYRQVNRIRSKFDALISAAGGVDLREARSAIFNGANIVVANIVNPADGWTGIRQRMTSQPSPRNSSKPSHKHPLVIQKRSRHNHRDRLHINYYFSLVGHAFSVPFVRSCRFDLAITQCMTFKMSIYVNIPGLETFQEAEVCDPLREGCHTL